MNPMPEATPDASRPPVRHPTVAIVALSIGSMLATMAFAAILPSSTDPIVRALAPAMSGNAIAMAVLIGSGIAMTVGVLMALVVDGRADSLTAPRVAIMSAVAAILVAFAVVGVIRPILAGGDAVAHAAVMRGAPGTWTIAVDAPNGTYVLQRVPPAATATIGGIVLPVVAVPVATFGPDTLRRLADVPELAASGTVAALGRTVAR